MTLTGVAVRADAVVIVDGQPIATTVGCVGGTYSPVFCSSHRISVQLATTPANGLRLLELQSPRGPVRNELPICVGRWRAAAELARRRCAGISCASAPWRTA
jgi:hypothetical protein